MKLLITGSTGLIGSELVRSLEASGHEVTRIVRSGAEGAPGQVLWDPSKGELPLPGLEGMDAAVHLAGENIASGRWTAEKKERIRRSRVDGTRVLSESLARLEKPPRTLISASAVGYYGDRGDTVLREDSPPGAGFLAEVCRDWEAAAAPAARRGIRVVYLRFGVVLSEKGGALAQMLPTFRKGGGGRLGGGRQYVSWISLEDAVGVVGHALSVEEVHGPVNAVAPEPVTNRDLTKTLGTVLGRPTILFVPAFVLRAMFGSMADEVLLASTRAEPAKLLAAGYRFRHPRLEEALRSLLGK